MFTELSRRGRSTETQLIDSTHIKVHRSASEKGESRIRWSDARVAGAIRKSTKVYDSAELRWWLRARGTKCVIPNKSNRKQPFSFSKKAYRDRSCRKCLL